MAKERDLAALTLIPGSIPGIISVPAMRKGGEEEEEPLSKAMKKGRRGAVGAPPEGKFEDDEKLNLSSKPMILKRL